MDKKKSAIRAGAVLVVALAAGHLVQTMNSERAAPAKPKAVEQVSAGADAAKAADPVMPVTASLTAPVEKPAAPAATPTPAQPELAALPEVPGAPPASALPALPELADKPADPAMPKEMADPAAPEATDLAGLEPSDQPLPVPGTEAPAAAADSCPLDLSLTAGPRAMISVSITAPCRGGQRVVLRHAGLSVAEALSETGTLSLDLPALNAKGDVSVLFPDAEVLRDAVAMPDAATTRRFAVQWMADDAFQLHAFENGADYGEPGNVSALSPVSPNGGYLVALGDPSLALPMMAEIYTWPADPAVSAEVVIESAVTDTTCGRELLGETVQANGGKVKVTDMTLAMPDCDAVGDILVLKNPGQDVTLAATN